MPPSCSEKLAQSHFTPGRARKRAFTRDFVHKSGPVRECPALAAPRCTLAIRLGHGGSTSGQQWNLKAIKRNRYGNQPSQRRDDILRIKLSQEQR